MSYILHRDLAVELPVVASGDGIELIDEQGRRYIDACGGAAVSCLGHDAGIVGEAVTAQLGSVAFAHTSFFTTRVAEELARRLVERAPAGFGAGRAMFLGSGSEAIEAALKLARQHHLERGAPARTRFIARDGAYHGNTLGALAIGGHVGRRKPYQPLLMECGRVPACYAYRLQEPGESDVAFGERTADALAAEIERLGPETVAAFVVEPVSGATLGCVPPAPGYFARIRDICDRYGVLLIADEVMCGAGRTGSYFALEQEGVAPDIVTLAKGLGAGFQPIAATLASERVVAAIAAGSGTLWNGHTYMSHAAACAGALAVLDVIERDGLVERAAIMGDALRSALEARFGDHPHVGDIRGRGLFQAIEFVADRASKAPLPVAVRFAARLKAAAMARGLMVYPAAGCVDGIAGDHVVIAPPYIVTPTEIDDIVERLALAIEDVVAESKPQ